MTYRENNRKNALLRGPFLWLCAGMVWAVAGCTVGPDFQRPAMDLPNDWEQSIDESHTVSADPNQWCQWWTCLNDPVLDVLVQQALMENLDLREARFRIEQSRAYRAYVSGGRLPQVNAGASYTRNRYSENGLSAGMGEEFDLFGGGFDAAWELDLFGGIKRSVESADASFEATVNAYYGQQISLQAEVASAYVDLRTLQKRIKYAVDNIEMQKRTLQLTEDLLAAGRISEVDVARARANLATTEAQIPSLQLAQTQTLNRLAVLLGSLPGDLDSRLRTVAPIPGMAAPWAVGLPADLLRRRPDVRRAERELAAQVAQIGVAEADLYPSFSLTGTFELQARRFSDWADWSSRAYSFGPNLRWSLFNGNRVKSNVRMQEALAEQARAAYEQTVLTAVEEVENGLASYKQQQERQAILTRGVAAYQHAVTLLHSRYESGLASFQDVLDAQRSLVQQQDALAVSRGEEVQALIQLYKALGGGWLIPEEGPQPENDS